ncbi:MAG: hypothetical protein IJT30_08295, partial [Muribaculaceae bacterium]|nr:hypothetical protein [Muribaculaceae bacterium]
TKVHDRSAVYYNIAQKYKKELTPQNLLASIFKKNSDTPNCQTCDLFSLAKSFAKLLQFSYSNRQISVDKQILSL